ncbi:MAG: hypothetical protein DRJ05_08255 [Bacteroidetes bacterium]|nr:MAG: hypothetical protein DRJ05_08255 [Bacteroidota bacterium]
MEKLPHRLLEAARRDPKGFAKELKDGKYNASRFTGRPKWMRWLDAAATFHKSGDKAKATLKLVNAFSGRKDTPKHREELNGFVDALEQYIKVFNAKGYKNYRDYLNINKDLTDYVRLTGQISIINENENGIVAYLIKDKVDELTWALELCYPVIQDYIAIKICKCELEKVHVGLIDFTTGKEYLANYSKEEVDEAIKELNKIGKVITQELY